MNVPASTSPISGAAGASLRHESATVQVGGTARYADDMPEPAGTLHAAFGVAPHAHARIKHLDLSAVHAWPGVVEVLTHADIPGDNNYGGVKADDPLLAETLVEYQGQPIFLVLADSHHAARRAARRASIDYEVLPAILTIEDALHQQSYIAPPRTLARGDATHAIRQAPHRIGGRTSSRMRSAAQATWCALNAGAWAAGLAARNHNRRCSPLSPPLPPSRPGVRSSCV